MNTAIWGVVKGGVIVPQTPVPEGACVQILVNSSSDQLPPDMQADFDAWNAASTQALEAFESSLQDADNA